MRYLARSFTESPDWLFREAADASLDDLLKLNHGLVPHLQRSWLSLLPRRL